jgi:DNA-binding IclR family transcriptional regulator
VLDLFATEQTEWGVREMADRLAMSRSTIHSALTSLETIGLLQRTPESRYRLGWRILQLAGGVTEASILRRAAPARMRALSQRIGESTHLGVWDGREMFFFARAAAANDLSDSTAAPGTTLPAHATASGKMLLGHLSEEASAVALSRQSMVPLTGTTITDLDAIQSEIAAARDGGLALSREETVRGVDALAVPVYGSHGGPIAALGVSMMAGSLEDFMATHHRDVVNAAASLSAEARRVTADMMRSKLRGLALEV